MPPECRRNTAQGVRRADRLDKRIDVCRRLLPDLFAHRQVTKNVQPDEVAIGQRFELTEKFVFRPDGGAVEVSAFTRIIAPRQL